MPSALDSRLSLAVLPSPLERLDRLGAALGMVPGALWVKRDDLTGLGGGGNKARKLEYLCADALARGADVLVTGGGPQSNHVRMTAAAANRLGLDCSVVMAGPRPATSTGNILLVELFDPTVTWLGLNEGPMDYYAIEAAIDETADRLATEGRRPYRMPIGGASAVGALGYVRAAGELLDQAADLMGAVDVVVVAGGSGGTHAGLAAGLGDLGMVLGVDVGARADLDTQVPAKAAEAAALAGLPAPVGRVRVDHERVGAGYGAATEECRQAVLLAARSEGMILDPVYTGKAMAGLIAARKDGSIGPATRTVFLHTGGMPALFAAAYAAWGRDPDGGGEPLLSD
ncbi:MAG TPA: pyridoxal-phosphate dependent enzyme [Acidimicrobiales bacterium]|nr:pyridoxal-phosphate dependent enzyme [Acidimicrobiales bacterium]